MLPAFPSRLFGPARGRTATPGRLAAVLFATGLALRLLGLPLWGTFDVEVQKAWAAQAATAGLAGIYGPPDEELWRAARERGGSPLANLLARPVPRTSFTWDGGGSYFVDYPPGSLLVLWAAGTLHRLLDPELSNGPAFNALVNLAPLAGSLAIALLLLRSSSAWGTRRALLFWLNPAVLLAAPVLGYQDTIFGALALGAVVLLQRGRFTGAGALAVAAGLVKPQGALVVPALLVLLAREARPREIARAAAAGLATAALVLAPWWTSGRLLSALDGCRRPLTQVTLAPLGLNVWWIAGWILRVSREGPWPLAEITTLPAFAQQAGFDPRSVSRLMLLAATLGIGLLLARAPRADRRFIPLAVILQVHAYALLGTSVHENHTLLAVILAPLLVGEWKRAGTLHATTSAFLFANLFLMAGGFGRRVMRLQTLRALRASTVLDLSVIVAAAHVVLFALYLSWAARTPARAASNDARAGPV